MPAEMTLQQRLRRGVWFYYVPGHQPELREGGCPREAADRIDELEAKVARLSALAADRPAAPAAGLVEGKAKKGGLNPARSQIPRRPPPPAPMSPAPEIEDDGFITVHPDPQNTVARPR